MIHFEKHTLNNGLRIILHHNPNSSITAVNTLYNVGARDEQPNKTGFAHLFEHLMFGGSANIPSFDEPLQNAGGENNAFTNNDVTNYYITLPTVNIDTAFWLESDRMKMLAFSEKSLEVQRNVVIQEFNQRYLNQPYGDIWLLLRPLVYKVHPYQWATIGKEIAHIADAKQEDVKEFFKRFYHPSNAILSVASNLKPDEILKKIEYWYNDIEPGQPNKNVYSKEPIQTERRELWVERNVPNNMIILSYNMSERTSRRYYIANLLSDILALGDSSRLHRNLVKEKQIFTELDAYISGSFDEGQFIISGTLSDGIDLKTAEAEILLQLSIAKETICSMHELEKVINKLEMQLLYSESSNLSVAMNLAFAELIDDASLINKEKEIYRSITPAEIQQEAQRLFNDNNLSILYYSKKI
jgi:predicted Zn-dependent peptidase